VPDDEMNENKDLAPEGEAVEAETVSRLSELESLIAQKDEALASTSARITELEQAIAGLEERLEVTNDSLAEAIASYQTMMTRANPEVPEEMIGGTSIEAIDQSLAEAKSLISHVKQGLEAEIQASRVPAGAPQRTPPDLSSLSPREKIQYGVRR
jgi:uncharacterized coiled-coil protein SlyX